MGAQPSFHIGAALNLNMTGEQTEKEIEKYKQKIDAGAQFIMTQPIYEITPLLRFLERAGKPPIPVLLGCIPLYSSRHAEYLHNEVPGITIPDAVRDRMRAVGERGHEESRSSKQSECYLSRPFCQCQGPAQDHPRLGMGKDASLRDQEEEGQQPNNDRGCHHAPLL